MGHFSNQPLIEPLALLHGHAARQAVAQGVARWFAGGPQAYALARLIGPGQEETVMPVAALSPAWEAAARRVSAPAPDAGLPSGPQVMGIINVTPDSFSDGGQHDRVETALARIRALHAAGCRVVDIGGEDAPPRCACRFGRGGMGADRPGHPRRPRLFRA